jgi:hypothetical protein
MKKIADEKDTGFVSSKILRNPAVPTSDDYISIFEVTRDKSR